MYVSEFLDLNCNYVKDVKLAWRKVKLRIWKFPYRAHNAIAHNLSYDIDLQLDTRMLKFVHMGMNHSNNACKSILLSKLYVVYSLHSHLITDICLLGNDCRVEFYEVPPLDNRQPSRHNNSYSIHIGVLRGGWGGLAPPPPPP